MVLAVADRTDMLNEAAPQHANWAAIGGGFAAFFGGLIHWLRKSRRPKAEDEEEDYATVREWRQSPAQELRHAVSALREATEGMDRAIGNMSVDIESTRKSQRRMENTLNDLARENLLRDERLAALEKRSEKL